METHELAQHIIHTVRATGKATAEVDGYKVDALRAHIQLQAWRYGVPIVTYWSGGVLEVLRVEQECALAN